MIYIFLITINKYYFLKFKQIFIDKKIYKKNKN